MMVKIGTKYADIVVTENGRPCISLAKAMEFGYKNEAKVSSSPKCLISTAG